MIISLNNPVYTPRFFYRLANKEVDLSIDVFKSILMDNSFFFLPETHLTLADVTSHQIATGNGYTQNDKTLTGGTLTEDASNFRAYRTFDGVSWTASGGALPAIGSLLIYDDTTTDDAIVIGYDFGISALYDADYVDSTHFTIDGDQTAWLSTGMRVRMTQTTNASAAITGVSYSSGTDKTTVTATGVDSGLTGVYIGSVYNISDGTPFTTQPITLEIKQTLVT